MTEQIEVENGGTRRNAWQLCGNELLEFCDSLEGSIDFFFGIVVHTTESNHSLGFCLERGRKR